MTAPHRSAEAAHARRMLLSTAGRRAAKARPVRVSPEAERRESIVAGAIMALAGTAHLAGWTALVVYLVNHRH
jgi:hypothetical protein